MRRKPIRISTVAVMLAVILLMMILSHAEEGRKAQARPCEPPQWVWVGASPR